METIILNYGSL